MPKITIYGLGIALFSLLNPLAAQSAADSLPINPATLNEEQIVELTENNPQKLMQFARDKKLNAKQLTQFVHYSAIVGQDLDSYKSELARLYWAQLSHTERLQPEAVKALYELNEPYPDNSQKLKITPLLYTLAHQTECEKIWGKAPLYQFQINALSLAPFEEGKTSLAQRQKIAAQHYAQVAKVAPLHAKTIEAKGNYQEVYTADLAPKERSKWQKTYFERYCCDPEELHFLLIEFIGQPLNKAEAQQWIKAVDRLLKWENKDYLNMPKVWLLAQAGQKAEAQKLLAWCKGKVWEHGLERTYPKLEKAMNEPR